MVKESRVLAEELAQEAAGPYESTPLARRAARARPRLGALLLLGAGGALLEAGLTRNGWSLVATAALVATAWGVWRARLSGAIAAGLVAFVAASVALWFIFQSPDIGVRVTLGFVVVWGVAMLPHVVTLLRDFELQHAYGLWARR